MLGFFIFKEIDIKKYIITAYLLCLFRIYAYAASEKRYTPVYGKVRWSKCQVIEKDLWMKIVSDHLAKIDTDFAHDAERRELARKAFIKNICRSGPIAALAIIDLDLA